MSTKNLFIIHIPKTAGTTLASILRQQYSPTDICGIHYPGEPINAAAFRALPAEDKERYSVFMGHVDFGFREAIPRNRPLTCMTVVRDPESRCLSQYNHMMNHILPGSEMSFRELVLGSEDSWRTSMPAAFDNAQVRYLAPVDHVDVPFGQCARAHLEQAKNNLRQHCDVVGTSERFVETLFLAHKAFGWQPLAYRNENLGADKRRRVRISDDDLALIHELNALDFELYEFAKTLMQEQLEAQGLDWQEQVAAFQKAQDEAWHRAATSFDPERYLDANPDVRAAGFEPLHHFLKFGQFEGRPGSPPLSGQIHRRTRACSAPWNTPAPARGSRARHLCPRIALPADPAEAREQLISVRYGLMTGVLARECAGCPIAPLTPLPHYLEQLRLKKLNILTR